MSGELISHQESELKVPQNPLHALDVTLGRVEFELPLKFFTSREREKHTSRIGLVRERLRRKEQEWRQMVSDKVEQTGIQSKTAYDIERAIGEVWTQTTDSDYSSTREITFLQSLTPQDTELMRIILNALQRPLEEVGTIPGWIRQDKPTNQFGQKYHIMQNPHISTNLDFLYLSLSLGTPLPREPLSIKFINTIRSLRQPTPKNMDISTDTTQNPTPASIKVAFTIDQHGFENLIISPPLTPYERQRID